MATGILSVEEFARASGELNSSESRGCREEERIIVMMFVECGDHGCLLLQRGRATSRKDIKGVIGIVELFASTMTVYYQQ